ncbi:MAG: hypothetical protein AB1757_05980 [Acidobacteriota bacterium]
MSQDVINCSVCDRRTPAARAVCLYCGAALPVTKIAAIPTQRILESFEHAFNTIIEPYKSRLTSDTALQLAEAMQVELAEAQPFLAATRPVPISRCQTRQEAELIAELVRSFGLTAYVVADDELQIERELTRARRVSIMGEALQVQHFNGEFEVPIAGIRLMVVGGIRNIKTDFAENPKGLGKKSGGVVDTAEFRSDELLLDVYAASLDDSFRIRAEAFDYSALVMPLYFRTELNFKEVINRLKALVPHAIIDSEFGEIQSLLARAWPPRSHTQARGVKRSSMFKRVSLSTISSDNRDQFERYSRLLFLQAKK